MLKHFSQSNLFLGLRVTDLQSRVFISKSSGQTTVGRNTDFLIYTFIYTYDTEVSIMKQELQRSTCFVDTLVTQTTLTFEFLDIYKHIKI